MTAAARLRALLPRSLRRPGVLGIALTQSRKVVLVRHTYTSGWHPPGGGRKPNEDDAAAVVRELREEIGLAGWSSISRLDMSRDRANVFILKDVVYRPVRSLEIEEVGEFSVDDLPSDVSPRLVRALGALNLLP